MLYGELGFTRVFNKHRTFIVDRGFLEFQTDDYVIEVFSNPPWETDFGSVPDAPLINYFIPYIGDYLDPAYLVHDALWQCRTLYDGEYTMEWTNEVLVKIAKESLKQKCTAKGQCDDLPWYRKAVCKVDQAWCQAYGWTQIQAVRLALSGITARTKWNNPSKSVQQWTHPIVKITKKDKK